MPTFSAARLTPAHPSATICTSSCYPAAAPRPTTTPSRRSPRPRPRPAKTTPQYPPSPPEEDEDEAEPQVKDPLTEVPLGSSTSTPDVESEPESSTSNNKGKAPRDRRRPSPARRARHRRDWIAHLPLRRARRIVDARRARPGLDLRDQDAHVDIPRPAPQQSHPASAQPSRCCGNGEAARVLDQADAPPTLVDVEGVGRGRLGGSRHPATTHRGHDRRESNRRRGRGRGLRHLLHPRRMARRRHADV